uniref:(California timema) hypothetical protein n=1 Tax=Timema californicum TaxID=61474 RepID=A0A7R9P679_TIMCA|nr:unnamed protein product [Timema californicum]
MYKLYLIFNLFLGCYSTNEKLKEVYSWKKLDFVFPSVSVRENALKSEDYIVENNLPLGLDIWEDKLFVTVPRWKSGVASTLNYINLNDSSSSPLLTPYPSWEYNQLSTGDENETSHDNIVSVFRVHVDKCDRLWVMDTGLADILGTASQIKPPTILVFDLNTDTLLRKHSFKDSDIKAKSFFANIVPDVVPENCNTSFAYIPDLGEYGLIVYDWLNDDSWRVEHHYFHFDPLYGNYHVGGVNFQWTDGVFGLALSAADKINGSRTVYFHALSSTNEFAVSNEVLKNKNASSNSYYDYRLLGSRGENTQATSSYYDETSEVLFYTQVNRNGIGCWNSNKPFTPENQALITSDNETFIFPNDLKVRNGNLWVLTDKMPVFIYKTLDSEEINYRIFMASVEDAIKNTTCEIA